MSNFLSKIKVKTASQAKRNKFDLSCVHNTTLDFFQNCPTYIKEMMPNETVKVNLNSFTRCSPLINPLFGNVSIVHRAFFVPCRVLMPSWNDFITQTPHYYGTGYDRYIPKFVPRIQLSALYEVFKYGGTYVTGSSSFQSPCDLTYKSSSASDAVTYYLTFTNKGRFLYKLLNMLGYKLNIGNWHAANDDSSTYVSAMPLLAFAKIWSDWFSNPQYDTRSVIDGFFTDTRDRVITHNEVMTILSNITGLCYNIDYFTAAWDNPTGPNGNTLEGSITMKDVSLGAASNTANASFRNEVSNSPVSSNASSMGNTPVIRGEQTSSTPETEPNQISQYILNVLHSVTDYVTRHRLVGSRALDRYMAEYGIQLKSEKLNRSVYLGKFGNDFSIGDVTQTSPDVAEGSSSQFGVGSYTGKMIGGSNGNFEYTTDEFGFFVICSYIAPRVDYVFGRPRTLHHLSALDFFKGDFDCLGTQAVRQDELFVAQKVNTYQSGAAFKSDGVFGFTPRFAEYKHATDNLTGDYICDSKNTLLTGWTVQREGRLDKITGSYQNMLFHSLGFCLADGNEYNDIWQDMSSDFDHFFTRFVFNVESYMPAKSLFDMFDYSNEDGKDLLMNLNGSNLDA